MYTVQHPIVKQKPNHLAQFWQQKSDIHRFIVSRRVFWLLAIKKRQIRIKSIICYQSKVPGIMSVYANISNREIQVHLRKYNLT